MIDVIVRPIAQLEPRKPEEIQRERMKQRKDERHRNSNK